jgi:hypothetical protein
MPQFSHTDFLAIMDSLSKWGREWSALLRHIDWLEPHLLLYFLID